MYSKKEDFLNQLQFELGHRWPDIPEDTIKSIDNLADYVLDKNKSSKWNFLRFLPIYFAIKSWIERKQQASVSLDFNLNTLSKNLKIDLASFIDSEFAEPITYRRPAVLKTIVFVTPLLLILLPLLISTYLITAKDYSGWFYMSGLIGLILSIIIFKLTERFKNHFEPAIAFEYAKSFYVVHNQKLVAEATKAELVEFLCDSAEKFYKQSFSAESEIPLK